MSRYYILIYLHKKETQLEQMFKFIGCHGKVFDAEKFLTEFGAYHVNCFKCISCQKSLSTTTAYKMQDQRIACKSCMIEITASETSEFDVSLFLSVQLGCDLVNVIAPHQVKF